VLSGLLRAGWHPDQIVASHRRPERRQELTVRYGIQMLENTKAVVDAETVILVVKPQDMSDLLAEISPAIKPGALVVSLAAGVDTAFIESHLPEGVAVVRVMPNTPAQVDEGMAAISPGSHSTQDHLDRVTEILSATGRVITVPERYQDAVTAISGTGPAYLFFVVEAMIEAGVHLGLPRSTATELVVQTMLGSAKLLRETGEHPTVLRERVTSPGGTTTAAIRQLEDHKVRAAFLVAMEAARDRSRELAAAAREDEQGKPDEAGSTVSRRTGGGR
jgi:pyrroline-5-carboxylate reductase